MVSCPQTSDLQLTRLMKEKRMLRAFQIQCIIAPSTNMYVLKIIFNSDLSTKVFLSLMRTDYDHLVQLS
jgi:hypothetical protein